MHVCVWVGGWGGGVRLLVNLSLTLALSLARALSFSLQDMRSRMPHSHMDVFREDEALGYGARQAGLWREYGGNLVGIMEHPTQGFKGLFDIHVALRRHLHELEVVALGKLLPLGDVDALSLLQVNLVCHHHPRQHLLWAPFAHQVQPRPEMLEGILPEIIESQ